MTLECPQRSVSILRILARMELMIEYGGGTHDTRNAVAMLKNSLVELDQYFASEEGRRNLPVLYGRIKAATLALVIGLCGRYG